MATKTVQDSSLTAVANAIRAKTGKSASMEFPGEFVSEIGSISGGGGGDPGDWRNFTKHMYSIHSQNIGGLTWPEHIQADFSYAKALDNAFNIDTWADLGLRKITVTPPITAPTGACSSMFAGIRKGLSEIVFTSTFVTSSNVRNIFQYCNELVTITGNLDWSAVSSAWGFEGAFASCSKLENVSFVANCIKYNLNMADCVALSNASLASVANALNSTASGQWVKFNATPKAALTSIMGTVSDGTFTLDASGSVSLQSFITGTKGWTLS